MAAAATARVIRDSSTPGKVASCMPRWNSDFDPRPRGGCSMANRCARDVSPSGVTRVARKNFGRPWEAAVIGRISKRHEMQRERAVDEPRQAKGEQQARQHRSGMEGPRAAGQAEQKRPADRGDCELAEFHAEVEGE